VSTSPCLRDFFKALGVEPFRGVALFAPDEQRLHGAPAMIVSFSYGSDISEVQRISQLPLGDGGRSLSGYRNDAGRL